MKIITEDFQSLKGQTEFEFNKGINIIVGPNGSGKSSLFYAIENCLDNPPGVDDCINHNAAATRVTLENKNESITWVREKGSSTYINNKDGSTYVKASKLNSLDLADLGFYFDKKGRVMNIHNEWSVLFPFGESDSDMFRLFEDIFNISCSFEILDNMKKDEQQAKSQIKQLKQQKEDLNQRIEKLNNIVQNVKLSDIENNISLTKSLENKKESLRQDYAVYAANCPLLYVTLPEVFDISILYQKCKIFETLSNVLTEYISFKNKEDISIEIPSFKIDFEEPIELRSDFSSYTAQKAQIESLELQLAALNNEKKNIDSEISKIKVCPTCGHRLGE